MMLVLWIISALLCAGIAQSKGRNVFVWGAIGLAFSVLGVVAALIVGEKREIVYKPTGVPRERPHRTMPKWDEAKGGYNWPE